MRGCRDDGECERRRMCLGCAAAPDRCVRPCFCFSTFVVAPPWPGCHEPSARVLIRRTRHGRSCALRRLWRLWERTAQGCACPRWIRRGDARRTGGACSLPLSSPSVRGRGPMVPWKVDIKVSAWKKGTHGETCRGRAAPSSKGASFDRPRTSRRSPKMVDASALSVRATCGRRGERLLNKQAHVRDGLWPVKRTCSECLLVAWRECLRVFGDAVPCCEQSMLAWGTLTGLDVLTYSANDGRASCHGNQEGRSHHRWLEGWGKGLL
ncbi:hypothetical protein C8Q76DRAFT_338020 [Earliella scabrosa]|nr:hypothetical protein C8Q76DRAFT_338020 [Earliella scabrosa]